jgi:glycosyltransferase involved in cell wall biosynthesis
VLTYHNDLVKERFTQTIIAKLAHFFLTAGALRRADRIIATSAYYIDRSVALRRHKHKITIVPPGVDTSLFNPQVDSTEVRQAYNNKHLILFVGSIEKTQAYKGLDYLIKSFAAVKATVPNAQLVIVGAGNGRQQYEQLARKLGIFGDVTFAGYKTQAELAGYSAAASVQVLPSTTNTEGFGMVLIEAGEASWPGWRRTLQNLVRLGYSCPADCPGIGYCHKADDCAGGWVLSASSGGHGKSGPGAG